MSGGMLLAYVRIWAENARYATDARDRHICAAVQEGVTPELVAQYAELSLEETQRIIEQEEVPECTSTS